MDENLQHSKSSVSVFLRKYDNFKWTSSPAADWSSDSAGWLGHPSVNSYNNTIPKPSVISFLTIHYEEILDDLAQSPRAEPWSGPVRTLTLSNKRTEGQAGKLNDFLYLDSGVTEWDKLFHSVTGLCKYLLFFSSSFPSSPHYASFCVSFPISITPLLSLFLLSFPCFSSPFVPLCFSSVLS